MTNVISISTDVQNIEEEIAEEIVNELEILGSSDEPVLYLPHGLVAVFDAEKNGYALTRPSI